MAKRVSIKHKRLEAPEWIFRWRRLGEPFFPKSLAILLVTAAFALFLTSVRIRVTSPAPWATRRAAVIQVMDDPSGRMLQLRAREGGPFLARFEPSEWSGVQTLEQAVFEAAGWSPPHYTPKLRELPEPAAESPVQLAVKGEPVFPKPLPPTAAQAKGNVIRLHPRLYPLSAATVDAMPTELPVFDSEVDPEMPATPWRFMVRLDAAGTVWDCISLADVDEAAVPRATLLETWLRSVRFAPAPDQESRWIAVRIGFTNQSTDGPELQ